MNPHYISSLKKNLWPLNKCNITTSGLQSINFLSQIIFYSSQLSPTFRGLVWSYPDSPTISPELASSYQFRSAISVGIIIIMVLSHFAHVITPHSFGLVSGSSAQCFTEDLCVFFYHRGWGEGWGGRREVNGNVDSYIK